MPKKAKKTSAERIFPRGNKNSKKDKTTTRQRQAVSSHSENFHKGINVKIKIDQSRRTNPHEPRAGAKSSGLPGRAYTANSSTPLHTTIMTATPSPTIIQKEPHYAETIKNMFKEAEGRQNNQLALLADKIYERDNHFNQLIQQTKFPPTKELYKLLMSEHQARLSGGNADVEEMPDEAETEGVKAFTPVKLSQSFTDPNAKVQAALKTPPPAAEGREEVKAGEVKGAKKEWVDVPAKRGPGRPKLTTEEKALNALIKKEAKKQAQFDRLKKVASTRANQQAGLTSPLVFGSQTPHRKTNQAKVDAEAKQKEDEDDEIKIKEFEAKLQASKIPIYKRRKSKKQE